MPSFIRAGDQPAASITSHPISTPSAGITTCCGVPSDTANTVRKLSWRPTTSTSAARSASTCSGPRSRNAAAMLYIGEGPCS